MGQYMVAIWWLRANLVTLAYPSPGQAEQNSMQCLHGKRIHTHKPITVAVRKLKIDVHTYFVNDIDIIHKNEVRTVI